MDSIHDWTASVSISPGNCCYRRKCSRRLSGGGIRPQTQFDCPLPNSKKKTRLTWPYEPKTEQMGAQCSTASLKGKVRWPTLVFRQWRRERLLVRNRRKRALLVAVTRQTPSTRMLPHRTCAQYDCGVRNEIRGPFPFPASLSIDPGVPG